MFDLTQKRVSLCYLFIIVQILLFIIFNQLLMKNTFLGLDLTKTAINMKQSICSHRQIQISQKSNPFAQSQVVFKTQNNSFAQSQMTFKSQTSITLHRSTIGPQNSCTSKAGAMIIRNILRTSISRHFKRMLQRLLFKKISFKLIKSKGKRDMQFAFLAIKNHSIQHKYRILDNIFQRRIELKIFTIILKRLLKAKLQEGFEMIKYQSVKKRHQTIFLNALYDSIQRAMKRIHFSPVLSCLKSIILTEKQQQKYFQRAETISQSVIYRHHNLAFDKIFDFGLLKIVYGQSLLIKQKTEEFKSLGTNTRQRCGKLRQKIKEIKVTIEQQKLSRNRSYNQRKKYNNSSKLAQIQSTRKFQKQYKLQNAQTLQIQKQCNMMQGLLSKRRLDSSSSQQWKIKCVELFKVISQSQNILEMKKIMKIDPDFQNLILQCQNSEVFIFKQNAKYQKLIDIYEKKGNGNCQAEYYSMDHENYVIKELIGCFIQEQYSSYIFSQKHKEEADQQSWTFDGQSDQAVSS